MKKLFNWVKVFFVGTPESSAQCSKVDIEVDREQELRRYPQKSLLLQRPALITDSLLD